jgi:hypothetical protein
MDHLTVAPSTQALLRLVDGPAMLSKHVRIGQYIVDAIILDAHPEVARWYGYDTPEDLRGRYVSHLHDARDLARVRLYAVARKLGLPHVPDEYDIRIHLPNGTLRWLRKQQVRQITDQDEVYWVSYSIPIPEAQARPMPDVTLPLSAAALEPYLGRCTVAGAEKLIEHTSDSSRNSLIDNTTIQSMIMQPAIPTDLSKVLGGGSSLEIPLGNATYRRWIHCCNRCQRLWVAEKAAPKKCLHCKSPYWNTPRARRVAGGRPHHAKPLHECS